MDRLDDWGFKSKKMEFEDDFYFDYDTEEITNYQDPSELLAALKQKEEEVILAAQLGNALLLENRQVKEESQTIHEQYADTFEELEQGKHDLRLKLEGCQSQWESQVGDLERDVRELSVQVEQLTQALSTSERDMTRAQQEHQEHTQHLREQLNTAMEVERAMTGELQVLKHELRQGSQSRPQDEELLSAMREQVVRLTQREQALEERLNSVCQENADLRDSLASLHTRLALQDQHNQHQSQQLTEAWREVEAARDRSQELQAQVEELQEEVSLQESCNRGDTSLQSELETSLETIGHCLSREQMTQDLSTILELLLPLTQEVMNPEGLRVLGQGEEPQEERVLGQGEEPMLLQLKGVAQYLANTHSLQELNLAFVSGGSDPCGKPSMVQELRDQNSQLQEENAKMRLQLENRQEEGVVQQAIRDRDEAITKKNWMEAELVRSKSDMKCLNNQLLEAIQRKLELSQELEDWQDDIQIIINQQLRTQQQSEQVQKKPPSNSMSFFRRPSMASTRVRQPSSSPSWTSEAGQDKPQSPWMDWLRRGKVAQHGK
ncbi:BICD family-like cargo adapter 1 [Hypomesus transpacificus]|uniref:BICD family-like cargo adapter 1 n=1 Tax=Hypomesus transpacificus TaxID=137520 RepID=UPI001F0840A5|nr:BICD family-like cargo adapter 1 [Hypomesus transpacificus]